VAVGTWLMVRTPETPVEPGPPIATARGTEIPGDLVPVIQPRVPDSTTGMLVERKYAYLDRDARRLLIFVADQFPEFPGPQAPENGEREPK
jgi:hypothetical protein